MLLLSIWTIDKIYSLYLIDIFSRFSLACVVHKKQPNTIINCIMQTWIRTTNCTSKMFLADNGGEFANLALAACMKI